MEKLSIKNGDFCQVVAGVHRGKKGIMQDMKHSKTGQITITVCTEDDIRFKTLGRNVEIIKQ
ncbi:hypothetical protein GCM10022216_19560 [Sphingobacterium kyonggiense]|uniref:KOW motif-containing protein n=1 Tax=Sphingobacterium kyonggiense TaxID=714075 RepID=A0ABP7YSX1_9SPHI